MGEVLNPSSYVSLDPRQGTVAPLIQEMFKSWDAAFIKTSELKKGFIGFNWTPEKVVKELFQVPNLALLGAQLEVLILYKEMPPEAEIYLLFKNKRQSSEVVKKALEFLIDTKSHITTWWLEVHAQNLGAKKLYEEVGFHQTSLRKNYYSDGESALIYSKQQR